MHPLSYLAFDHQGKAEQYLRALDTRYERVEGDEEFPYPMVDFVLTDNDVRGRRADLERLRNCGAAFFFVYPHAARPNLVNDVRATWSYTTAQFVAAQGHADVMRRFGYEKPIHVVGWHLCPLRAFQPRAAARKILFAPIHPRCAVVDQRVNRETFNRLRKLAEQDDIQLTVRYIRSLALSGLEQVEHPNIRYTPGDLAPSWTQIDQADVVVAHQTFAWLAVARGVPTVMMAEDMPMHLVPKNQDANYARSWSKYVDLLAYPLDILQVDDTLGLLNRAARSDQAIIGWRKRMIGRPFDGHRFLAHIESYVRDLYDGPLPYVPKVKSRYQGRGDVFFVVNPHGAVHDCKRQQASERLLRDGYRLATDDEIRANAPWGMVL